MEIKKISDYELPSPQIIEGMTLIMQICAYSGLLIAVLNVVKFFTGRTADAKIDQVIDWLKLICVQSDSVKETNLKTN